LVQAEALLEAGAIGMSSFILALERC